MDVALAALLAVAQTDDAPWRRLVREACVDCHGPEAPKAGLDLASILQADPAAHAPTWEKAVRRLRARQMPPPGKARPAEEVYRTLLDGLEARLDAAAPDPGRPDTLRRLSRAEYRNAVRDLLHLDIDAASLLPADESTHGFDSATAGALSASVLDRYLSAAERISRLALGRVGRSPGGDTFRVRPDLTQEERLDGLPPGTRGGLQVRYTFPADGDYDVRLRLMRDRNEEVEGLAGPHELLVLLDRKLQKQFTVRPPGKDERGHAMVDAHLLARLSVSAGPHELAVTFLKQPSSEPETLRQPYVSAFNAHRHPRRAPALYEVSIVGPYDAKGPGDSPSRRRLLAAAPGADDAAARAVLAPLLRRAFRRPVVDAEIERYLRVFRGAREGGDFESGLEAALGAVLVSHDFLFRIERDPEGLPPRRAYALGDLELATRLSFFLWGSLPDDSLLDLAERGELRKPGVLEREARRLLADPRAGTLATSFAAQWLQIRNLEGVVPDGRLYPDFDDNLRRAMRRETELLFEEIVREDLPVTSLLRADHAWLNERLARHYGIPHVLGDRFRRVDLDPALGRGGLLRQASVLTVTSYANRTSPVLRGKWILETLIGTPPPPPPPDVPALVDDPISEKLPVRERLKQHRQNPACAVCHRSIDPAGFALEVFDAVGRRRDGPAPVDAAGGLPDGSVFEGVDGLEAALLRRPELLVEAMAEKLLTYALGRAIVPSDGPALRGIVRAAAASENRFSALVAGIVNSVPFRMRRTP